MYCKKSIQGQLINSSQEERKESTKEKKEEIYYI
jgi:hypothetical protein